MAELRSLDLRYDRDGRGEFVHFYTGTVGEVFVDLVERRDGATTGMGRRMLSAGRPRNAALPGDLRRPDGTDGLGGR